VVSISSSERSRRILWFKRIATVLATFGILALGAINIEHKRSSKTPEDGCAWIDSPAGGGVQARYVVPEGPADRAGILPGDILRAITANGVRHEIQNDRDVARVVYGIGVWSQAIYSLERNGVAFEASLVIAQPSPRSLRREQYLEIIGLL
jgi:S1-C subfamily serine protease